MLISNFCFVISAIDNKNNIFSSEKKREQLDFVNCTAIMLAIFFTFLGILMMLVLKIIQCCKKMTSNRKYSKIVPQNSTPEDDPEKAAMGEEPGADNPMIEGENGENEENGPDGQKVGPDGMPIDNDQFEKEFLQERGRLSLEELEDKAF